MTNTPSERSVTKRCKICGREKILSTFHKNRSRPDGHMDWCKPCRLEWQRKFRVRQWEHCKEQGRTYYSKWKDKHSERQREARATRKHRNTNNKYQREQAKQNPLKVRARAAVRDALKRGELARGVCEQCGAISTHAHHDDYNKRLKVRWLCGQHHADLHRARREANDARQ